MPKLKNKGIRCQQIAAANMRITGVSNAIVAILITFGEVHVLHNFPGVFLSSPPILKRQRLQRRQQGRPSSCVFIIPPLYSLITSGNGKERYLYIMTFCHKVNIDKTAKKANLYSDLYNQKIIEQLVAFNRICVIKKAC
ncbi:MAG: hypothetical protein WCV41_01235 [Patescibacteria group bacterium]